MYETHFGLRRRPFRPVPDTESYYPATTQEQALAELLRAFAEEEGIALLTGAAGTGKTLLCHCLLDRLGDDVASGFLTNSHIDNRLALLQALLYDLALPHRGVSEQEARIALSDAILRNYDNGQRSLLLVDEAQHLTPELLEELRLLSNLEGPKGKACQVCLVALPQIAETLNSPELAALRQRLAVQPCLAPLDVREAMDFLLHELRVAGGTPNEIISDEALEVLARGARGIPRLLKRSAQQAFSLAYSAGAAQVDAEAAIEALVTLGLSAEDAASSDDSSAEDGERRSTGEDLEDSFNATLVLGDEAQVTECPKESVPGERIRGRLFASPRKPA